MIKKEASKDSILIFMLILIFLFIIPIISAGFLDWINKTITGKLTSGTVSMNITVGVPQIITVYNSTLTGISPTEAPAFTNVLVNFSVYSPSGAGYLNDSMARVNLTKANEASRYNFSCSKYQSAGNYANYTCNVTIWWWDGAGVWNINATIRDNSSNLAVNDSTVFSFGTTTAVKLGPGTLSWNTLSAGATNQTPTDNPLLLNNTGNVAITNGSVQVNATNLRGETDNTIALWAGNFSVHWGTGSNAECAGTTMNRSIFTNIEGANLTKGNYTINNGNTGQEQLYICLKYAGTELTTQSYSTSNETAWTVKIA